jgi:hypothetical protein
LLIGLTWLAGLAIVVALIYRRAIRPAHAGMMTVPSYAT